MNDQLTIHPATFFITIIMVTLAMKLPKKYALYPLLFVVLYITGLQRFVLGTLDFTIIRLITTTLVIRIILRNEAHSFKLVWIDKFVILSNIYYLIAYALLRKNISSFLFASGQVFDSLMIYLVFRILIININHIYEIFTFLSVLIIPFSIFFLIEQYAGINLFSVLGGVPFFSYIREGRIRSQGSFPHPLLAGAFGSSILPLFVGMVFIKRNKKSFKFAIISCLLIIYTSASSGPLIGMIIAIFGMGIWYIRKHIQEMKLLLVMSLLMLALYMKAPIWALVLKLSIIQGSTSYHRYAIIDQTIKRFREWWLFGIETTENWGPHLWDVTNEYASLATRGGFLAFLFFIIYILISFVKLENISNNENINKKESFFYWCLWSSLLSHVVMFIGMSYFGGQINAIWFLLIASIATIKKINISENNLTDT